jgi:hypothetical protein
MSSPPREKPSCDFCRKEIGNLGYFYSPPYSKPVHTACMAKYEEFHEHAIRRFYKRIERKEFKERYGK